MDETQEKIILAAAGTGLTLWCIHKWLKHVRNAEPKLCARHDDLVKKLPIPEDLECPTGTPSVFFGISPQDPSKQICKPADKDGHIGVFGESSRGKTTGIVIPTMGMFPGPQFILDTKGNLADQWRQHNRSDSRVLKEFRCSALDKNPYWIDLFEPMRQDPENASGHAWELAETLLPIIPGDSSAVWREAAQNLLAGALLYYFKKGLSFADALAQFCTNNCADVIKAISESSDREAELFIKELMGLESKVLLNIGLDLKNTARLLTTPIIRHAVTQEAHREQLSLSEFAMGLTEFDIIFEVPDASLDQIRPLLELLIKQLMHFLSKRPDRFSVENPPSNILLLLDEFPRLGKITSIKEGLNFLRSRGVTFVLSMQSIASLEQIYGNADSRVILDNLRYKVILGATDVQSEEYFSKLVGDVPIETSSHTFNIYLPVDYTNFVPSLSLNVTKSKGMRPYIYPHAFQTLREVVVVSPSGTCLAKKYHAWETVSSTIKEVKSNDTIRATGKISPIG